MKDLTNLPTEPNQNYDKQERINCLRILGTASSNYRKLRIYSWLEVPDYSQYWFPITAGTGSPQRDEKRFAHLLLA